MIFSVFGGSLISFVMWNSSFSSHPPSLSLSDQNSKKNFTEIWMKIQVTVDGGGYWHLTKMWSGVQFQWINKTSRVQCTPFWLQMLQKLRWRYYWRGAWKNIFKACVLVHQNAGYLIKKCCCTHCWEVKVLEQQTKGNHPCQSCLCVPAGCFGKMCFWWKIAQPALAVFGGWF